MILFLEFIRTIGPWVGVLLFVLLLLCAEYLNQTEQERNRRIEDER